MLNKDQYNQDEYNNYYKQESGGADILQSNDEGGKGKILVFLGLIALAVAGYFGFQKFNSTTNDNKIITKEKLILAEPIKEIENKETQPTAVVVTEETIEKTIKEEIAEQVQASIANDQEMSAEEISQVVKLVMSRMHENKDEKTTTQITTDTDSELLNALEQSDTDTVKVTVEDKKIVVKNIEVAVQEKKEDNYNKVTVKDKDEDLTKLSEQIKKLLNMAGESSQPNKKVTMETTEEEQTKSKKNQDYAQSISKELKTRSNEMRVIVVKSGDTLNKIAKRAYGNGKNYPKILAANPEILNQGDKIYVGQKLRIPK